MKTRPVKLTEPCFKWHAYVSSNFWRARRRKGNTLVHMSREIVDCPSGLVVDHIDGDTLNNQKSNLRVCTQKENAGNKHIHDRCTDKTNVVRSLVTRGRASRWIPYKRLEDIVI